MPFVTMKRTLAVFAVLVATVTTVFAQDRPAAILEYFDDELEIQILDEESFEYNDVYMGMELIPGDTVRTFASSAELRLEPNGTIIKLAPETEFTIDALAGREQEERTNSFDLARGKMRAVAAEASGTAYRFRTPGAMGGIRGTDFGIHVVPDEREALFVREGSVSFENVDTGEEVTVHAGQLADVFKPDFTAEELDDAALSKLFEDLEFTELSPPQVPRRRTAETEEEDEGARDDRPAATPEEAEATPAEPARAPAETDEVLSGLSDIMGLETGAVTLEGDTYAKIVLQPTVSVGPMEAAFYLPAVYRNNLFDPGTYYRPKGNDEWSFGTDKDWENEPGEAVRDLLTDLALKLRYLEYGERRDPFHLKLGNLDKMTLGHGLLMRDYANDVDFPAVRRIGLNTGLDIGSFGMEAAVNDLTEPEIYGGRLFFRPLQRTTAFGLSAVADIGPAGDLPENNGFADPSVNELRRVDPIITGVGADLDVSIVETDLFSLVAFTDVGGLMPYLRDSFTDSDGDSVSAGLHTETLIDSQEGRLRNYGAMTGVLGDFAFLDYRLDFRTYDGIFRPFYFDGGYERRRGEAAQKVYRYLENPDDEAFSRTGAGVYGEAGFTLFGDNLRFSAGYLWPWNIDAAGEWTQSDDDYLSLRAELREGLLPLGIHASAEYDRRGFMATAAKRGDFSEAGFFDADSVVRSEVVIPVAPTLDLAVLATTTVPRNDDGTIRYDADGKPEISNSVSIETRIGL
ncbi:MAG: FecR family protein [Spirochaetota bacterium]